jgi:NADP-dependent 3-hydroxy acid dehydrogenase YdfG
MGLAVGELEHARTDHMPHRHAWVRLPKARERTHDDRRHRPDRGDHDLARHLSTGAFHPTGERLHLFGGRLRHTLEIEPGVGRRVPTGVPLKEPGAERHFERIDVAEHRRAVDAELLGRRAHRAQSGHGVGRPHLVPAVHDRPLGSSVVVITGGTGGIGFQSALGIAQTGARVVIVGRNAERGEAARAQIAEQTNNPAIELVVGDVSSASSVDALAEALLARPPRIDVLVNNAGYLGDQPTQSADGLEMHFAVNVFAPRRLTLALLPALKAADGARVINVTGGNKAGRIDPDNLQAEKGFKGLNTYSHSKSVMEAMSMDLSPAPGRSRRDPTPFPSACFGRSTGRGGRSSRGRSRRMRASSDVRLSSRSKRSPSGTAVARAAAAGLRRKRSECGSHALP